MIQIQYLISGKLKNGGVFQQKEFYVYAENGKDAEERIDMCLNNDEKVSSWKIEKKRKVKNKTTDSKHMLGVWYEPFSNNLDTQMVIQLKTQDMDEDLKKRYKIEDYFDVALKQDHNGHCDGGDIGSGTLNIFAYVIDVEKGLKAIKRVLKENSLLKNAVIAILNKKETFEVIYPKEFKGDFSY